MSLTRYRDRSWLSPWRDIDQVADQFNRFLSDPSFRDPEGRAWVPAVDVEETKDQMVLTAELPGMRREDVEIAVENNVLTISGKKEETRENTEESRYHVWERRSGTFQRSFSLPRTVNAEGISATYEDGVLRVEMPKAAEAKGRRIEIRTGS